MNYCDSIQTLGQVLKVAFGQYENNKIKIEFKGYR